MGTPIIQPSRVRRLFNGWCHGLFAGQRFDHVLNLGCGHDHDRQGYTYSGYFDSHKVTRMDKALVTDYPLEERCLNGGDTYTNPVDVVGNAETLTKHWTIPTFDMVFCNWMIYHTDYKKVLDGINVVLERHGKLMVTYMDKCRHGLIYKEIEKRFNIISYCYLYMDNKLDGRDWVAEGIWGEKR